MVQNEGGDRYALDKTPHVCVYTPLGLIRLKSTENAPRTYVKVGGLNSLGVSPKRWENLPRPAAKTIDHRWVIVLSVKHVSPRAVDGTKCQA